MSNSPDFCKLGYQIERLLGQNRACGRVTYKGTSTNTQMPVVIKQVQLAHPGTSWLDYDTYQREVQVLQKLDHPCIPRYLDSFVTTTGFYLVQEYKKASSLAPLHHWTPAEVKQIAVAVLEVLVYLQQQVRPIIHRDIKPENILVERQGDNAPPESEEALKVTLVDFGFACVGGGEVATSSVVKGTLGFMPPEQLFNRQLTEASDLYSLGVTLICLLTQTKSTEVGNLIDETYHFNFKLLPQLSPQFIDWLEKMVAPSLKNRYPNAVTALKALQPLALIDQATTPGTISRAVKRWWMMPTIGLTVTLLSKTVFPGANLAFYNSLGQPEKTAHTGAPVKQLLATNQCPRCDLTNVNLGSADLTAANLEGANLGNAFLGSTNFKGGNLGSAYMGSALLGRVNLENAYLGSAYLENAYLGNADLKAANLRNADLRGAYLRNADLTGAYLEDADLTGAKLRGANLTGAYLEGAYLEGADLTGAKLRGAKMPDGTIHP